VSQGYSEDAIRLIGNFSFGPYLSSASDCRLSVFRSRRTRPATPPSNWRVVRFLRDCEDAPVILGPLIFVFVSSVPWLVFGSGSRSRDFPGRRRLDEDPETPHAHLAFSSARLLLIFFHDVRALHCYRCVWSHAPQFFHMILVLAYPVCLCPRLRPVSPEILCILDKR